MKKFFGWVFIVVGVVNLLLFIVMVSEGAQQPLRNPNPLIAVGLVGLGIWMINPSKSKKK